VPPCLCEKQKFKILLILSEKICLKISVVNKGEFVRRIWRMKKYIEQQRLRRENIEKRLLPTHGCLTLDDYAEQVLN
jgi:hypothetical protein